MNRLQILTSILAALATGLMADEPSILFRSEMSADEIAAKQAKYQEHLRQLLAGRDALRAKFSSADDAWKAKAISDARGEVISALLRELK